MSDDEMPEIKVLDDELESMSDVLSNRGRGAGGRGKGRGHGRWEEPSDGTKRRRKQSAKEADPKPLDPTLDDLVNCPTCYEDAKKRDLVLGGRSIEDKRATDSMESTAKKWKKQGKPEQLAAWMWLKKQGGDVFGAAVRNYRKQFTTQGEGIFRGHYDFVQHEEVYYKDAVKHTDTILTNMTFSMWTQWCASDEGGHRPAQIAIAQWREMVKETEEGLVPKRKSDNDGWENGKPGAFQMMCPTGKSQTQRESEGVRSEVEATRKSVKDPTQEGISAMRGAIAKSRPTIPMPGLGAPQVQGDDAPAPDEKYEQHNNAGPDATDFLALVKRHGSLPGPKANIDSALGPKANAGGAGGGEGSPVGPPTKKQKVFAKDTKIPLAKSTSYENCDKLMKKVAATLVEGQRELDQCIIPVAVHTLEKANLQTLKTNLCNKMDILKAVSADADATKLDELKAHWKSSKVLLIGTWKNLKSKFELMNQVSQSYDGANNQEDLKQIANKNAIHTAAILQCKALVITGVGGLKEGIGKANKKAADAKLAATCPNAKETDLKVSQLTASRFKPKRGSGSPLAASAKFPMLGLSWTSEYCMKTFTAKAWDTAVSLGSIDLDAPFVGTSARMAQAAKTDKVFINGVDACKKRCNCDEFTTKGRGQIPLQEHSASTLLTRFYELELSCMRWNCKPFYN